MQAAVAGVAVAEPVPLPAAQTGTRSAVSAAPTADGVYGAPAPAMAVENLHAYYGGAEALHGISLDFPRRSITALIGPSGCGKTTLLRTLNRMNDLVPGFRIEGRVLLDGRDIYSPGTDVVALRRRVGMVFQRANPFPMSILDNVAWALRGLGLSRRERWERAVESLERAGLWDEVKDRLHEPAFRLSGGQRQRLCIARAIAVRPSVLLMDEPTSALDPIAAGTIEDLMLALKEELAIILVSHNMQQAARTSDRCAFLLSGRLVEYGPTAAVFGNPRDPRTEAYVTGRLDAALALGRGGH